MRNDQIKRLERWYSNTWEVFKVKCFEVEIRHESASPFTWINLGTVLGQKFSPFLKDGTNTLRQKSLSILQHANFTCIHHKCGVHSSMIHGSCEMNPHMASLLPVALPITYAGFCMHTRLQGFASAVQVNANRPIVETLKDFVPSKPYFWPQHATRCCFICLVYFHPDLHPLLPTTCNVHAFRGEHCPISGRLAAIRLVNWISCLAILWNILSVPNASSSWLLVVFYPLLCIIDIEKVWV